MTDNTQHRQHDEDPWSIRALCRDVLKREFIQMESIESMEKRLAQAQAKGDSPTMIVLWLSSIESTLQDYSQKTESLSKGIVTGHQLLMDARNLVVSVVNLLAKVRQPELQGEIGVVLNDIYKWLRAAFGESAEADTAQKPHLTVVKGEGAE